MRSITATEDVKEFLAKFFLFSFIYGAVFVNWLDVFKHEMWGYHLWLICMYFLPAGVLLAFDRSFWIEHIDLLIAFGLMSSLWNDIFYGVWAWLLHGRDLIEFFEWQFGMGDGEWYASLGFTSIPVTSQFMALTIYLRAIVILVLLTEWWRRHS